MKLRPAVFPLLFLVLAAALAPGLRAAKSDIPPPRRRAETVALAQTLLAAREPGALPPATALKNPFNPANFTETDPGVAGAVDPAGAPRLQPDRELLEAIAQLINPSGTIVIGGEPVLLFGGMTRRKVGDVVRGTYAKDGKLYELTITAIEGGTFTLRYHDETYTQPINKRK